MSPLTVLINIVQCMAVWEESFRCLRSCLAIAKAIPYFFVSS